MVRRPTTAMKLDIITKARQVPGTHCSTSAITISIWQNLTTYMDNLQSSNMAVPSKLTDLNFLKSRATTLDDCIHPVCKSLGINISKRNKPQLCEDIHELIDDALRNASDDVWHGEQLTNHMLKAICIAIRAPVVANDKLSLIKSIRARVAATDAHPHVDSNCDPVAVMNRGRAVKRRVSAVYPKEVEPATPAVEQDAAPESASDAHASGSGTGHASRITALRNKEQELADQLAEEMSMLNIRKLHTMATAVRGELEHFHTNAAEIQADANRTVRQGTSAMMNGAFHVLPPVCATAPAPINPVMLEYVDSDEDDAIFNEIMALGT